MRRNSGFVSLAFSTVLVLSLLLSVLLSGGVCLADNWVKTAEKGLEGNYSQVEEEVCSMAVYGSVLYAGTNNSKDGCQVWAYGGGTWTKVVTGGFGDKNNVVARSMLVHNSRLYVGTGKLGLGGCEVWSFDGGTWAQVNTDGFGAPQNTSASSMTVYGYSLFVGTENNDTGGQVWKYGGTTWVNVNAGGFGNVNNRIVNSLCAYGTSLFAGTANTDSGGEVWKYDGSAWTQSVGQAADGTLGTGKGFGGGAANHSVSAMAAWNGKLYAGLTVTWGSDVWEVYMLIPKLWAHKVWSYDGAGWTAVPVGGDIGGYGGPNFGNGTLLDHAMCMGVYGSSLIVGSRNEANGCQVWSWNGTTWTMLNTFGFGSGVKNNRSSAMAVSGSNLYIGTGNSPAGAEVWRYDSSTWQRLSALGFAGSNNYRASRMAVLGGYLYAGTASREGAELWRTNGSTWSPVGTGGFGDSNNVLVSSMTTLGTDLYLGTRNSMDGGEVFRWNGGSLVQVNNSGFHPNAGSTFAVNDEVASMAVYNSAVWAGTHNLEQWNNLEQGCRIYRFDGTNWVSEQALGFGDKFNLSATSMCAFGDSLYVGTANSITGCEVWRRSPGGWQQVNTDGFGSASNGTASSMAVLNGSLYVGVSGSTGQLWKYDGSTWSKVGSNGFGVSSNSGVAALTAFGNTLYAGTTSGGGGQAWRYDGQTLEKASSNGLGDTSNTSVSSLAVFGSKIFAGTLNETRGCEILSSLGPPGSITGASPNKGSHGQTLGVTITGEGTHFANGTSQATFSGTGITVNSTAVSDPTHATANITIAGGAGPGVRDVNVITGQDTPYGTTNSKFTVLDPRITGVSPDSVLQGRTLDVTVTGAETSFAGGSQAAFSGTGITVNSTTVLDATRVRANITVADDAAAGRRDVNVATGGITTDPLVDGLTVDVSPPRLDTVVPAYGTAEDVVTLNGQWFGEQRLSSKVQFNGKSSGMYVSWSDDSITCTVPAGVASGKVVVTTAAGSSSGVAFKVVNTKPGTDVSVNTGDGTTVVFDKVTSPGNTISLTASDPVVDGFTVLRGTTRDVTTDAGHSGKVAVTLSYAGLDLLRYQEENLVLLHEEGGSWSDVTTGRNEIDDTVTGEVAGLSKFAIAIPSGVSLPATATWYLAEGSTKWGFQTWITIENPNNIGVTARVTYMTPTGKVSRPLLKLPAMSQTTLNPATDLGETDFSTKVECLEAEIIAVDRTMTWTGPGSSVPGAHSTIGLPGSDNNWYMPEGSSKWGFETWLLVQNPNTQAASCKITYMVEGAGPVTVNKTVPASSRASFNMLDDIGAKDASIQVSSDLPVICERSMYRNNRREGHNSIATTEPEADYYLAEGSTDWGFTTYVLVQNPNSKAAEVTLSFMTSSGPIAGPTVQMAANSRKTFRLNDILPKKDCSIRVHGSLPIIAERAMYWNNGTGEAMHASIGVPGAHKVFYLPDGQTIIGWETWTLVQNPNSGPVEIEVTYLTPSGAGNIVFTDTVPANSRKTYNMGTKIMNQRAAVMVKCKTPGKKIIVERSMYWNNRGSGTCTIGGYSD